MEDYKKSYPDGMLYPEVSEIGQMNFIIVGTDSNSRIMVIPNEIQEPMLNLNSNKYTYFRFAIDVKK